MKLCAVGTGFITKSMLEEFAGSQHLNCTSICSRQESKGLAMGEPFGITKVYTSLEDMLTDPEVEAVYIASPNALHYPQTKAALLAGKHVLCEKPMTLNLGEAAAIAKAVRRTGKNFMIAHPTRYTPAFILAKKMIARGDIGEV